MKAEISSYRLPEHSKNQEQVINLLAKPTLELNHLLKFLISKGRLKDQSQSQQSRRTRKLHHVKVFRTLLH